MALTKHKIGELITVCDERNSLGLTNFHGLNIKKEFMPTVADTEGLDESKYKVVRNKRFVFSGMQTGRDQCIRISMYTGEEPIIVSPAYTTFEVSREDIVLPEYFFMIFLSKEKDRWGAFCSDGSIRTNLDWERFIDFELTLPSIEQQHRFVDIYMSLKENYATYLSKVDNLKTVCEGYIENLKKSLPSQKIGEYIIESDERNSNQVFTENDVVGVSIKKDFIETKADMDGVPVGNYKVIRKGTFVFNVNTARMGDKFAIALCDQGEHIVSSIYGVFHSKDESKLLPEYLFMYFIRPEFDRYVRFNSWGSARETFTMDDMREVAIPIPDIKVQQEIVNIHRCYIERQRIAARLKEQFSNICPILIRGSILTEK